MERLLIDTDPGVDDAHAIMMAAACPNVKIEALTTVAGNVDLDQATANALRLLDLLASNVPVFAGAADALVVPTPRRATSHGTDGLGDSGYPYSQRSASPEPAPLALIRLADSAPKEITLVALGPLTNIALATKLDPELPGKFKRLIVMGGAYLAKGNSWTPAAEFNFYVDPEAAHIVLNEWPQITVAPWETAMAYPLSVSQVEQLGQIDAPQAEFFQRSVSKRFIEQIPGQPALYEPDAIAMAAAIEPDIVLQQETCYAQVELAGSATRGQLVVDWFHLLQKLPNVNIVTAIDRDRFWQLMQLACGAPVR